MGEDFLDGVGTEVTCAFGAAGVVGAGFGSADKDRAVGAFGPGDGLRGVEGSFDVAAIEVGVGTVGGVDELDWEAENVLEKGALLIDLVDVEAEVYF